MRQILQTHLMSQFDAIIHRPVIIFSIHTTCMSIISDSYRESIKIFSHDVNFGKVLAAKMYQFRRYNIEMWITAENLYIPITENVIRVSGNEKSCISCAGCFHDKLKTSKLGSIIGNFGALYCLSNIPIVGSVKTMIHTEQDSRVCNYRMCVSDTFAIYESGKVFNVAIAANHADEIIIAKMCSTVHAYAKYCIVSPVGKCNFADGYYNWRCTYLC
jgi:hypothetical protein